MDSEKFVCNPQRVQVKRDAGLQCGSKRGWFLGRFKRCRMEEPSETTNEGEVKKASYPILFTQTMSTKTCLSTVSQ